MIANCMVVKSSSREAVYMDCIYRIGWEEQNCCFLLFGNLHLGGAVRMWNTPLSLLSKRMKTKLRL